MAITDTDRPKFVEALMQSPVISETMVVSTCNRVEIYAVVDAFHPALEAVGRVLGEYSGLGHAELTQHAYVHYSEAAVEHLFNVASGLDSMVIGEQQILGQIRSAYTVADECRAAGSTLHELAQQALRVGKRVHAETGIDRAGASVVSVAVHRARALRGVEFEPMKRAVVIGAGAMASLATTQLARDGVEEMVVVNRTADRAALLAEGVAERFGIAARGVSLDDAAVEMTDADIVVACTGSVTAVLEVGDVHSALIGRTNPAPLMMCDLGLPRNIEPAAGRLPGVRIVDIESLRGDHETRAAAEDADAARGIVAAELDAYLLAQRQAQVTPTVAALRQRAADLVEAEILRLETKLPGLDGTQRDEVAKAVRRVADKLLHAPTVRVKQLASSGNGDHYAEALRELFELQPGTAEQVVAPDIERRG